MLNRHLIRLRDDFGLRADIVTSLMKLPAMTRPHDFFSNRDGETYPLLDLRSLVSTVRKIGEKGIRIYAV